MAMFGVERVTELVAESAELTGDRLGRADSKPETRVEFAEENSRRLRMENCFQAESWSVGAMCWSTAPGARVNVPRSSPMRLIF